MNAQDSFNQATLQAIEDLIKEINAMKAEIAELKHQLRGILPNEK